MIPTGVQALQPCVSHSRPLSEDATLAQSCKLLAKSGSQILFAADGALHTTAAAGAALLHSQPLPAAAEQASDSGPEAVVLVAFEPENLSTGPARLLAVTRTRIFVSSAGAFQSVHAGAAVRGAIWHPTLSGVVAYYLLHEPLVHICQVPAIGEGQQQQELQPAMQHLATLCGPPGSRTGANAAAWTSDGQALVISWPHDVQIHTWEAPSTDAASWAAEHRTTTTILSGLPAPRLLATGPAGSVVGTIDAQLVMPQPSEWPEPSSSEPAAALSTLLRHAWSGRRDQSDKLARSSSAVDTSIDLRGRFSDDSSLGGSSGTLDRLFNIAGSASSGSAVQLLPSGRLEGASALAASAAAPARICLMCAPSAPTQAAAAAAEHSSVANVMLPRPDCLVVRDDVALVASSSGPPVLELFHVSASTGITALRAFTLTYPAWASSPAASLRLRGVVLDPPIQRDTSSSTGGASSSINGSQHGREWSVLALLVNPQPPGQGSFTSLSTAGGVSAVNTPVPLGLASFRLAGLQEQLHRLCPAAAAAPQQVGDVSGAGTSCVVEDVTPQEAGGSSPTLATAPVPAQGSYNTTAGLLETNPQQQEQLSTAPTAPVQGGQQQQRQQQQQQQSDLLAQMSAMFGGLQAHMDRRLDQISSTLDAHAGRLAVLEQEVWRRPPAQPEQP